MKFIFHVQYIWLVTSIHCREKYNISGKQFGNVFKESLKLFSFPVTKKFRFLGIYTGEIMGETYN